MYVQKGSILTISDSLSQELRRPDDDGAIDIIGWAQALKEGTEAVQKYGGATPGCRTMLDALVPATAACLNAAEHGEVLALISRSFKN